MAENQFYVFIIYIYLQLLVARNPQDCGALVNHFGQMTCTPVVAFKEPTNYLDQPALAALAAGLKSFSGGVLVISHTASFVDEALC